MSQVPSRRTPVHVGPADHGRRMSSDEFDGAIGPEESVSRYRREGRTRVVKPTLARPGVA